MKKRNGFTLIEILIAITLFMLILTGVYSVWVSIMRGTKVGLQAAAEVQRSRIALRAIEDALVSAQMFEANMRYYYFVADTTDENFANLSFAARLPTTFPGAGMFGDQVVRRVSFNVEAATNNNASVLMMYQIPIILETNDVIQPYPIQLARDITMFNLRFWDERLRDWTDEFQYTNQLPKMVEVTLGFGRQGGFSREPAEVYQRIVSLPASIVTRDMQNPTPGAGLRVPQLLPPVVNTLPDGTKILKDGSRVLRDGTRIMPDGTRIPPRTAGQGIEPGQRPNPQPPSREVPRGFERFPGNQQPAPAPNPGAPNRRNPGGRG